MIAGYAPISLSHAIDQSSEDFIWSATLRSGDVIFEQPGLSSDALPRDEVQRIEYIPTRRKDLPVITCKIDLDRGERFVRYWTTVWKPTEGGQRLYVLGVEKNSRVALLAFYPTFKKIVVSDRRPFQAPWVPETFAIIPQDTIVRGGPGTNNVSWLREGFGGMVVSRENSLEFSATYE